MQAAQLAAQAAMQEAAARESGGAGGGGDDDGRGAQHPGMDMMDDSSASLGIDAEQLGFLRALQAAESGDQAGMADEMHMMGLSGNASDENMQSLLQMLAQQEQENSRPDEHYLTIAQNGEIQRPKDIYYDYEEDVLY